MVELWKLRPEIVLVFFAGYGERLALFFAKQVLGARLVFLVTYPYELVPHQFYEFRRFGLDRQLDEIIVISRYVQASADKFFNRRSRLIPLGVDTEYFCSSRQQTASASRRETCQLVTVAALERRKGFGLVLAALPQVIAQVGTVHYTIVGEGPDRRWLEAEIQQAGLEEYVTLVGGVEDVRPYLVTADLFLLPSYGEGLPNAYLEALAMGLPTIVSTDPPYDEIASDEFAVRVPRNEPPVLAEAIVGLLKNPERRARMGAAARREAEVKYSWPAVASKYDKLFAALVHART